jgi:hypothetical protein
METSPRSSDEAKIRPIMSAVETMFDNIQSMLPERTMLISRWMASYKPDSLHFKPFTVVRADTLRKYKAVPGTPERRSFLRQEFTCGNRTIFSGQCGDNPTTGGSPNGATSEGSFASRLTVFCLSRRTLPSALISPPRKMRSYLSFSSYYQDTPGVHSSFILSLILD